MEATTKYAKNGDVHIAHRVFGNGPRDVVPVRPGTVSHVELYWELPANAYRRIERHVPCFSLTTGPPSRRKSSMGRLAIAAAGLLAIAAPVLTALPDPAPPTGIPP